MSAENVAENTNKVVENNAVAETINKLFGEKKTAEIKAELEKLNTPQRINALVGCSTPAFKLIVKEKLCKVNPALYAKLTKAGATSKANIVFEAGNFTFTSKQLIKVLDASLDAGSSARQIGTLLESAKDIKAPADWIRITLRLASDKKYDEVGKKFLADHGPVKAKLIEFIADF